MNPEFLSGEASASPAVETLLDGARTLAAAGLGVGALSARNGPRTTTHAELPFARLQPQDFIEVADYDPHLDRILCLGRRDPHALAGAHHLILRAKKELGAIIQVEGPPPSAGTPTPRTQLDLAMRVLEDLRKGDVARVAGRTFVVGRSPQEAVKRALQVLAP